MFRYKHKIPVFSDFSYSKGKLVLVPHKSPKKIMTSPRDIISPPPKTTNEDPGFIGVTRLKEYIRGSPSPFTRLLGNLHMMVRPLRQAVYHRLGEQGPIKEVFPTWDKVNNEVVWTEDLIFANDTLDYLLDKPQEALDYFCSSLIQPPSVDEELWWNHIFALRVVVYELVSVTTKKPLLELLEPHYVGKEHKKKESIKESMQMQNCIQCSVNFGISESEKEWMISKGFSLPKRCKDCRQKNKQK